jgi:hypothetical protein
MPPPIPTSSFATTVPAAMSDRAHELPKFVPLRSRIGQWLSGPNGRIGD